MALSCAPPVKGDDTSGGRPANRPPDRAADGWMAKQVDRRRRASCSALLGGGHRNDSMYEKVLAARQVIANERGTCGCDEEECGAGSRNRDTRPIMCNDAVHHPMR
jgi:hypothetical protein